MKEHLAAVATNKAKAPQSVGQVAMGFVPTTGVVVIVHIDGEVVAVARIVLLMWIEEAPQTLQNREQDLIRQIFETKWKLNT
jgi:hypothetical protein